MKKISTFLKFSVLSILLTAQAGSLAGKFAVLEEQWKQSGQSVFDYCEGLYYSSETPQKTLCEIYKLEANDNTINGSDYIECNFRLLKFFNNEGRINSAKIIEGFHAFGILDKDLNVTNTVSDCGEELQSEKPIDYYTCFLINHDLNTNFAEVFKANGVRPHNAGDSYDNQAAVDKYNQKAKDCSSDTTEVN
ncbi:uncharacterized protein LOC129744245 [Uranotaenia lowii]|uniref:uncharacterized protein LOC129744245 n=1 Tax=Uranotaenia lowii TaxID=190385 RepID=UPI002479DFB2|nr:uncharacterized protein LOC129744245 [Uranotaenia lowii]